MTRCPNQTYFFGRLSGFHEWDLLGKSDCTARHRVLSCSSWLASVGWLVWSLIRWNWLKLMVGVTHGQDCINNQSFDATLSIHVTPLTVQMYIKTIGKNFNKMTPSFKRNLRVEKHLSANYIWLSCTRPPITFQILQCEHTKRQTRAHNSQHQLTILTIISE